MPSFEELSPSQRFFFARIFPLFPILAGGVALYFGVTTMVGAAASKNWPVVEGTVIASSIRAERGSSSGTGSTINRTTYHAEVVYEYVIKGTPFSGERVNFGEYGRETTDHAAAILDRYPEGTVVSVHYDPEEPERSVLEPGMHGVPWFWLLLGTPIFLFGVGLAVVMPRLGRR
jgi:hypothetical protein